MLGSFVKFAEDLSHDLLKTLELGFCHHISSSSPPRLVHRMTILQIMSIFAVMVNSGIIAFTGTYTEDYRWSVRVWIFITFTAGVLV